MEEYFANEIVQSCGKEYETEVTKMGSNYTLFLTVYILNYSYSNNVVLVRGVDIGMKIHQPHTEYHTISTVL